MNFLAAERPANVSRDTVESLQKDTLDPGRHCTPRVQVIVRAQPGDLFTSRGGGEDSANRAERPLEERLAEQYQRLYGLQPPTRWLDGGSRQAPAEAIGHPERGRSVRGLRRNGYQRD